YWLTQPTTVTFATSGTHTIRVQVREDGVQLDQIVLSPQTYLNTAPGSVTSDATVVTRPVVNSPPSVSLIAPATGASYQAPATITLTANATDSDGTIARVDFYAGTTLIGSHVSSPYSIPWSNVGAGTYTLTARAIDNQ